MKRNQKQQIKPTNVTIKGVVEILEASDGNGPFDAIIVTDLEEEFFINVPNKKVLLSDYADEYVQVSGTLYEKDGFLTIAAKRISIIDPEEDDPSYDTWAPEPENFSIYEADDMREYRNNQKSHTDPGNWD